MAHGCGEQGGESGAQAGDPCKGRLRALLPEDLVGPVLEHLSFRYVVASCAPGSSVTIWGPGGVRRTLVGHTAEVDSLLLLPFSDRVLTRSRDGGALIWDTNSGRALRDLGQQGSVQSVRMLDGGDRLVACSGDGACTIWNPRDGEPLLSLPARHADFGIACSTSHVEVLPSGGRLLTWGCGASATVWDVDGDVCSLRGHTGTITIAKVFNGGDRVVTIDSNNWAIIWNTSSCKALCSFVQTSAVTSAAVSAGGEAVATVSTYGWVTVWNATSGEILRSLTFKPSEIMYQAAGVEAFPLGDRLAAFNLAGATIWNATSGEILHTLAARSTQGIAVSPCGRWLATCGGGKVTLWDTRLGARVHYFSEPSGHSAVVRPCSVAIAFGRALDKRGFEPEYSWSEVSHLEDRGWSLRR